MSPRAYYIARSQASGKLQCIHRHKLRTAYEAEQRTPFGIWTPHLAGRLFIVYCIINRFLLDNIFIYIPKFIQDGLFTPT